MGGQFCTVLTLTFFDMERMATFAEVLVLNNQMELPFGLCWLAFSYAPDSDV